MEEFHCPGPGRSGVSGPQAECGGIPGTEPHRIFHHTAFADTAHLLAAKRAMGQRISVCIPTLNERQTIGDIVACIRESLMRNCPLVDELLVIDSGSDDGTREIAAGAGARVHLAAEVFPTSPVLRGKGENLWKALHVSSGDLICYLDGDISSFHVGFVTGLLGPLLVDAGVDYVKAYYERPLEQGGELRPNGSGRVSELLVRPLISAFYPELSFILQPLAGEYAARRSLLESLDFPSGYGVEIAHLIDLAQRGLLTRLAQTDLVTRHHRNRDEGELGDTAFAILQVIIRRLERDGKISLHGPVGEWHQRWRIDADLVTSVRNHIPEFEHLAIFSSAMAQSPRARISDEGNHFSADPGE